MRWEIEHRFITEFQRQVQQEKDLREKDVREREGSLQQVPADDKPVQPQREKASAGEQPPNKG